MHGFDPSAGKEPINYGFASVSFELKGTDLWLILLTLRWLAQACAYKIGTWAATSSIKCLLKMLAISMLSVINHPSSKSCIRCFWVPLEGNKGLNFFPEFTRVGTFSRSLNEIGFRRRFRAAARFLCFLNCSQLSSDLFPLNFLKRISRLEIAE